MAPSCRNLAGVLSVGERIAILASESMPDPQLLAPIEACLREDLEDCGVKFESQTETREELCLAFAKVEPSIHRERKFFHTEVEGSKSFRFVQLSV